MSALISDPVAFLIAIFAVVILWSIFCAGGWKG